MGDSTLQWNAELYQETSTPQYKLGLMAIGRLNPRDGEQVLDIGCGNGLVTIEIARKIPGGRVTGIEASPEMCAKAADNLDRYGISNVTLININAMDAVFNAEYDAVFSNSAIHWIQDLSGMYRLILQSLKPGGRILVQTGIKEMNRLVETIIAILQMDRYRKYFSGMNLPWRFLSVDDNASLLQEAGFEDISIESYPDMFRFDTVTELAGYLESAPMVPFLSLLEEEVREEFTGTFLRIYLEKTGGELVLTNRRAFISARKNRRGESPVL
jgi:trans-aconitate 2-methyltransferase